MKKSTKIISLLLAVLMFVTALPITAFAAKNAIYIKEIRISTASTAAEAKKFLTDNGYTVVDTDLNQKTGKDYVYIGYKTTTNPDEAITDISLMQMDGGYSFSEYEALLEQKMQEINNMLDSLSACLAEARANLAAGQKNAQGAREVLNFFTEDDSGKLLGDFLLGQEPSRADLVKVFLQGNGSVTTIIYNMLAFACTDNGENTSWLAKLKDVDIYADYDPLLYSDAANAMFESFVNIHDMMVTYENEYKDVAKDIENNPEYADYTDEEMKELLPDSYLEYTLIYETLAHTQYGGKSLLDFFKKDPYELDTEELYPIVSTLSAGQQQIIKFINFDLLITFAQADDDGIQTIIETLKESCGLFTIYADTVSVYFGVDRSLFTEGGVALTTASLRKSASTGDNSWFSGDNIDPALSIALHSVAGSFAALSIGAGIGARFASKAAKETYNVALRAAKDRLPNYVSALRAQQNTAYQEVLSRIRATNPGISWDDARCLAGKEIAPEFRPLWEATTNGSYERQLAKEASAKLARLGVALDVVMGVAMGIMLIAEGINMGIRVYNYYHPDYTEIPRAIIDEVVTDTDSYFVNYYAVKDQTGASGDLNAWSAQRWNALYTTTDKKAGDPIIASSLVVKLKDSSFPSDEHGAVHYFGETAAANVNRYQFRKTATATYIFYERDHSLSMTASTFSTGQLVMFTGFGLLGGVALGSLGILGAGKLKKKKKDEVDPEDTPELEEASVVPDAVEIETVAETVETTESEDAAE